MTGSKLGRHGLLLRAQGIEPIEQPRVVDRDGEEPGGGATAGRGLQRRFMKEGGAVAVGSDQAVVGEAQVKKLEAKARELERLLGKKTMEVEILREALERSQAKN